MLEEESVDKDVATTHFAEENTLSSIVEKTRIVPRQRPSTPEDPPQSEVLDECYSTAAQPDEQPDEQPADQPDEQPDDHPPDQPDDKTDEQPREGRKTEPYGKRKDPVWRQPV